jgi:uncharacterized protein YegP (UPF0339 family)
MAKQPKIEIVDSKGGKFRVRYVGKNGELLAPSEPVETRKNCHKNTAALADCLTKWLNGEIQIEDKTKKTVAATKSKGRIS